MDDFDLGSMFSDAGSALDSGFNWVQGSVSDMFGGGDLSGDFTAENPNITTNDSGGLSSVNPSGDNSGILGFGKSLLGPALAAGVSTMKSGGGGRGNGGPKMYNSEYPLSGHMYMRREEPSPAVKTKPVQSEDPRAIYQKWFVDMKNFAYTGK